MSENAEKEKYQKELRYLDENVFDGLTNLNDGFDSPKIKYFSGIGASTSNYLLLICL